MNRVPNLSRWGLSGPLELLPGGNRNPVFRCGSVVIKATRRSEESLRWLAPVHDAARRAGFVVPRPVETLDGRLAAGGWTAEEALFGQLARASELSQLAPLVVQFHRFAVGLHQRPDLPGSDHFAARRVRGGDVDLGQMPDDLASAIRRSFAAVLRTETGIVHGDLNTSNMMLTPDGPALIDWDETRRDSLFYDRLALGMPGTDAEKRAAQAWEIACCWQIEPTRARRLAKDFIRSGGSAPIP